MKLIFWFIGISLLVYGCDISQKDIFKSQGEGIYKEQCANCHQEQGTGFAKLYPPLAKSDYLINHKTEVACMIKNGTEGKMTVDGVEYDMKMPPQKDITPIQLAYVMTYIYNSWGNDAKPFDEDAINEMLKTCKTK